jgi:hypothetical protein
MKRGEWDNGSKGRNLFLWSEYDRLPALVRLAMSECGVSLGTRRATVRLARGMQARHVAAAELNVARAAVQDLLREAWPPGHPDLRA